MNYELSPVDGVLTNYLQSAVDRVLMNYSVVDKVLMKH